MSLTDKDIDNLYSASAEGLSFEYNENYWEEFNSQLSDTQETSLSDSEIDSMYAASAAGLGFDYNENYWDEFNSQLPETKEASLSDAEIDSMYAASAAGLGMDYKPEYWNEFNSSLPDALPKEEVLSDEAIDSLYAASAASLAFDYAPKYWSDFNESFTGDAVLSDSGIDNLYQESSEDLSFNYQPSYWEEFKRRLRRRRRPDFLWFATAYSFVGVMGVMLFMNDGGVLESSQLMADTARVGNSIPSTGTSDTRANNLVNPGKNGISTEAINNIEAKAENGTHINGSNNPSAGQQGNPVPVNVNVQPGLTVITEPLDPTQLMNPTLPVVVMIEPIDPIDPADPLVTEPIRPETNGGINPVVELVSTESPEERLAVVERERIDLTGRPSTLFALNTPDKTLQILSPAPPVPNFAMPSRAFVIGYAQAFGGLSQSLVTPSVQNSYSYGVGVGIEVHKKNLTYTFGLNAILENHNDLVLNRIVNIYGQGRQDFKFTIDYQQMYKLESYLGLGYNLGRHNLNVGVRPSFVVSSKVRIEEIGTSSTEFASGNDYDESRYVYGFMDGIYRFGLKPTIGYSFNLTSSLKLGGTVGIEVMPSINENFVNGMSNRLPFDGQLYIRKTFSFKK